MRNFSVMLIYVAFFALIGFAIYFTGSGQCLWALLLGPYAESKIIKKGKKNEKVKDI